MTATPRRPVVLVASIAAAGLAVAGALALTAVAPLQLTLGLTTTAVALAPLVRRIAGRSFDLFEPIVGGALMLAVTFGIRPVYMWFLGVERFLGAPIGPRLDETVVIGFLATSLFMAAYELIAARPVAVRQSRGTSIADLDWARVVRFGAVATGLGLLLYVAHLSLGGSPLEAAKVLLQGRSAASQEIHARSSEYLSAGPILISCAGILVVLAGRGALSRRQKLLALTLVAIPAAIFLVCGGARRFAIPTVAIPLVLLYLTSRRRPSLKKAAIVVPILFVALAMTPFARSAAGRQVEGGVVGLFVAAAQQPVFVMNVFFLGSDTEGFSALAVELDALDDASDHFFGRATVGDLVLAPIPSEVFPWKPRTARDALLVKTFGTPCRPAGKGCRNVSVVGTFYADGWYLGVVLGMVLLGGASAAVWRFHLAQTERAAALALAATWTVFLPIIIRASFMPPFAWFLYFLIPTLAGIYLAGTRAGLRETLERVRWPGRRGALHGSGGDGELREPGA